MNVVKEMIREQLDAERALIMLALNEHSNGDDHQAFRAFICDVERKQKMWDTIVTSSVGALIIGVLYWTGSHALEIAAWLIRTFKS